MATYHVELLKNKTFKLLNDTKFMERLRKWSLVEGLHLSSWAFNESYEPQKVKDLVDSVLKLAQKTVTLLLEVDLGSLAIEPVPCTLTSMEFFDRLLDPANGLVSRSGDGSIRGCFEEKIDDFIIDNELRKMLLNEASDVYPLYSRAERRELLFRLLLHIALGGQWCQYEDIIHPYVETAVIFYKSLLNVQKERSGGDVQIRSKCFRVIFPEARNIQDFIYVLIDPGLREITLLAHRY